MQKEGSPVMAEEPSFLYLMFGSKVTTMIPT